MTLRSSNTVFSMCRLLMICKVIWHDCSCKDRSLRRIGIQTWAKYYVEVLLQIERWCCRQAGLPFVDHSSTSSSFPARSPVFLISWLVSSPFGTFRVMALWGRWKQEHIFLKKRTALRGNKIRPQRAPEKVISISNIAGGAVNIQKIHKTAVQCHPSTITKKVKINPKKCDTPFAIVALGKDKDAPRSKLSKSIDCNTKLATMKLFKVFVRLSNLCSPSVVAIVTLTRSLLASNSCVVMSRWLVNDMNRKG